MIHTPQLIQDVRPEGRWDFHLSTRWENIPGTNNQWPGGRHVATGGMKVIFSPAMPFEMAALVATHPSLRTLNERQVRARGYMEGRGHVLPRGYMEIPGVCMNRQDTQSLTRRITPMWTQRKLDFAINRIRDNWRAIRPVITARLGLHLCCYSLEWDFQRTLWGDPDWRGQGLSLAYRQLSLQQVERAHEFMEARDAAGYIPRSEIQRAHFAEQAVA